MAETLNLEVKSNIKSVTQETKDWGKVLDDVNEEIKIQNEEIVRQERLLIKLKAQQDAIPKGGWVAGMDKLNDKIRNTNDLLNLEKNTLKSLTNQQKEATKEVKQSTEAKKGNNKESKESIANFQIMGVSLNGVKKGFSQIIPTAKAMFSTIRAGMISTGIGALVIGVMALIQSFKRSEEGQEKFQRIMAAIGAVTSQVLDAFSDLGEIIIETFTDPLPAMKTFGNGLLKFLRDPTGATRDMFVKATLAATDFVEETEKEIGVLDKVTKMRQKAHHIDRELKVERAKANRKINDIRLKAEDREKFNATERIALLRKAQKIEEEITTKEIESKKLLINAQIEENKQGLNTKEAKDKLAQLQADLINLDTKKLRSQRLLQTQITTAINEEKAIKEQKIADDEAAFDRMIDANDKWNEEQQRQRNEELAADKKLADDKIKVEQAVADAKVKIRDANLDNISAGLSLVKSLAGENKEVMAGIIIAENALGIARTIISTQAANAGALASPANVLVPGSAIPIIAANNIAMGISIAASIAAAGQGLSALGKGGATGGTNPSASGGGDSGTPAPEMMSGSFELTGGEAPEPLQAYVVSDSITDSQNALAVIRRRATI